MDGTIERRGWFGLRRREGEERALPRQNLRGLMLGGTSLSGVPVSERSALQLVDVLACVRLLAETASTLPLIAYRRRSEGRERLSGGRLADLLTHPAPALTQAALVGQLVASLATRGNGFLGKYRNGEGEIEQLGVLPAERVTVELKAGIPLYTLAHADGRQTTHTTADVLHVRMPLTLDGVLGLSPIAQAREALGLARSLGEQASALIANESAPLGILSVPSGPAQEDLMENLRSGFEMRHRGPRNAGRVAVLSGDVQFSAISITPHDAEFVEQRRLSTAEIARLFRVPPWMIGAESGDSLTYSNTESQGRAFLTYTLAPYLTAVEQAVSNDLDLCAPPVYVEFLRDAILQADTLTRAQVYTLALDPVTGWLRRDEVRQLENAPPETDAQRPEPLAVPA
ncbi:MAG: phage portal protein [Gaiellaceae bacterium]